MKFSCFLCIFLGLVLHQAVSAGENVLARSAAKLQDNHSLTVAYLGGSLTAGSGAKRANETSWRAQTRDWFIKTFPDATITEVNAAIGGTGSGFGVFRVGNDVLSQQPDLVFVEFSVNDAYDPERGESRALRPGMEGIVRQIWQANPMADIVFVYTTKQTYEPYHIKRELSPAAKHHQDVADYHGIASVNVGQALWDYMHANNRSWEDITLDRVHPRDEGYEAYSKCMLEFLEAQDWSVLTRESYHLPEVQLTGGRAPVATQMLPVTDFVHDANWSVEAESVGDFDTSLYSTTPGAEIRISFVGNAVGIYHLAKSDSSSFLYSLDGAPFKVRKTAFSGARNGRPSLVMLLNPLWRKEVLPMEAHELVIRLPEVDAADETAPHSGFRIAAVAINGEIQD